jgi:hypothetical protein
MNALRFPRLATFAWACALVAGLAPSAPAEIVYTMTNASNLQDDWVLAGTITLSGTGTGLESNDITSWAYTVTKGSDSYTYSSNNSDSSANGNGLLATPTQLILQYGGLLGLSSQGGDALLAWDTGDNRFPSAYSANDYTGDPLVNFWQHIDLNNFPSTTTDGWVIGSVAGPPSSVPEIDPNSIGSVLALVLGSMGLLERRRLKAA